MDDAQLGDLVRRHVGDVATVEQDGAARRLLGAADGAQQGRLAGAVGAEQRDDLALADVEVGAEQHLHTFVADIDATAEQERRRVVRGFALARPTPLVAGAKLQELVATIRLEEVGGAEADHRAHHQEGNASQ